MENSDLLTNELQVSPASQNYLSESAKWGKFLAIVGFIFCGLMVILALFIPAFILNLPPYNQLGSGMTAAMTTMFTIIYLIFAVIFFFPCLFLYRFSVKMKVAINSMNQENFESSLQNLKSLFKFYGIVTIVMLAIYGLGFIFAMLGAAFIK